MSGGPLDEAVPILVPPGDPAARFDAAVGPLDDPSMASENEADILASQGRWDEARPFYLEAVEACEASPGCVETSEKYGEWKSAAMAPAWGSGARAPPRLPRALGR